MLEQIKNRRSCRKFDQDRPVEAEKLQEVVNAGLAAATGMGRQEGIVIAVVDKKKRDALAKLNAAIISREGDTFYGAPVILLVCAKKSPFSQLDGAAMLQNMLVEAENQGLGSCWIHRAKEELETTEFKELFKDLGIDFDLYEGVGHVALGYPKDFTYPPKTIKPNRFFIV